jgi:hypothetical protein
VDTDTQKNEEEAWNDIVDETKYPEKIEVKKKCNYNLYGIGTLLYAILIIIIILKNNI